MMISTLRISRVCPYLAGIFLWAGTMTLAQATADPADEQGPVEMQAPMPANHEMPNASMDPVRPGTKMGSEAKMKFAEKILKVSVPASVLSTLPAIAGASFLYHVGATGFCLNLNPRIDLTADQEGELTQIKANALLFHSAFDRQIEIGEQELWLLTAVNSPSAIRITAKMREIERDRGDERIAFIRSVGEAGKVLTPVQQAQLLDNGPAVAAASLSRSVPPAALTAAPLTGSTTP